MPGMNLKFLNNPSQRIATGKSLPLKQLEAIVAYGTAEQRAKVVAKVLPQTYTLSLHKSTHHILTTILIHCDNLVRTQMLYHLRRKLNDMARSPVGNVLLQQLLEYLPNINRKEIAEAFVLNAEEGELETLATHPFGNHVAQKLLEFPASADVIVDKLQPMIQRLVLHPTGQRIVAKLVENVEGGHSMVCSALFPSGGATDDEMSSLEDILKGVQESLVISALLKHPSVSSDIKDGIIACLLENVTEFTALDGGASLREKTSGASSAKKPSASYAEPDFISGKSFTPARSARHNEDESASGVDGESSASQFRHSFAYASALEYGDDAQRKELYAALKDKLAQFAVTKGQVVILLAMFKFAAAAVKTAQSDVVTALFASSSNGASEEATTPTPASAKKKGGKKSAAPAADEEDAVTVALHPVKTVALRAVLEMSGTSILGKTRVQQLVAASNVLAVSAIGGPVLQRLVEFGANEIRAQVFEQIEDQFEPLAVDPCGSFLVQQLIEYSEGDLKDNVVKAAVDCLCVDPHKSLATAQGSRTLQKLVAYASDDTVKSVVDAILAGEEDEEEEPEEDEEAEEGAEGEEEQPQLSRKEQREANRKKHYKIRDRRLLSYAVHNHACFAVQALLREVKSRQLDSHRKRLMNSLKPYVFDLAVSPWAGRVVLDVLIVSGSTELKAAIKNIVFMKAEGWLSDVPAHAKGQAGLDPTMRQTLRRGREDNKDRDQDVKKSRTENRVEAEAPVAKKPAKKLFRTLKK
jgi:hypothetical protein